MAVWIASAVVLILSLAVTSTSGDGQYCNPDLCPRGGPHVACNPPPTNGGPTCSSMNVPRKVALPTELRDLILEQHNLNRSNIALGKLGSFPQAVKMPTLVWDTELASLADANARSCNYANDKCRGTKQFRFAGQNIEIGKYFVYNLSYKQLAQKFIASWWEEYSNAQPAHIAKFPESYSGIEHFTQIASDRTTKVGCAMWYWQDGQFDIIYFVCNYSMMNIPGKSVYKPGSVASQCKKGRNSKFPGLCNPGETPRSITDG